jgi:cell division septum initiation protein DivIVA
MESLDTLHKKIDAVIKKNAALEAENKRLKHTITKYEKAEASLNKKINSLEHDMVSVSMGATVKNDEARENMRNQLDTVIGEIDKILGTLND